MTSYAPPGSGQYDYMQQQQQYQQYHDAAAAANANYTYSNSYAQSFPTANDPPTHIQGQGTPYGPPSPSPSNNSNASRNPFKNWFRSRSNSPNPGADAANTSGNANASGEGSTWGFGRGRGRGRGRSRSNSPNVEANGGASPSSFVVRNVVKQGGVSWADEQLEAELLGGHAAGQEQTSNQDPANLQYRRSKSKPIGAGMSMSLGVPPGGPGGGTGYGTAMSSNDGRPEIGRQPGPGPGPGSGPAYSHNNHSNSSPQRRGDAAADATLDPPSRPVSPGHTKAAAFQRKSNSPAGSPGGSPGGGPKFSISAGPSPGGSPGGAPLQPRPTVMAMMRASSQGAGPGPDAGPPSPTAGFEPSTGTGTAMAMGMPTHGTLDGNHRIPGFDPSSFGGGGGGGPSGAMPMQPYGHPPSPHRNHNGQPIPMGNGTASRRESADARAAGFGFIGGHSPSQQQQAASPSGSPGLASRIRGFFGGKHQREDSAGGVGAIDTDEEEENDAGLLRGTPYGVPPADNHGSPARRTEGFNPGNDTAAPPMPRSSPSRRPPPPRDPADAEAELQRRKSQREAVRLIDEERRRAIEGVAAQAGATDAEWKPRQEVQSSGVGGDLPAARGVPTLPSGLANDLAEEGWTPEVLERMTEKGRQDLVRRLTDQSKSKRGTSTVGGAGGQDAQSEAAPQQQQQQRAQDQEEDVEIDWHNLTPAQRIIAETRYRQLQQDRIEAAQSRDRAASPPASSLAPQLTTVGRSVLSDSTNAGSGGGDEDFEKPKRRSTRATSNSPRKAVPSASAAASTVAQSRVSAGVQAPSRISMAIQADPPQPPPQQPQQQPESATTSASTTEQSLTPAQSKSASTTTPAPAPASASEQGRDRERERERERERARGGSGKPPSAPPLKTGLSPGEGPMPAELGLMPGLQEMMTRFYRFERYAVPLLRALEMRLVDIERDAQMAQTQRRDDVQSDLTGRTSERDMEMDRWVGQMTGLMKHEIGQLKAATKEIREGREMLAVLAKRHTPPQQQQQQQSDVPVARPDARPAPGVGPRGNTRTSVTARVGGLPNSSSGATAASALSVLEEKLSTASQNQSRASSPTKEQQQRRQAQASQLSLPPGSAPALEKHEGKSAHGSRVAAPANGADRARSTSPNGRPKYTSALGRPLVDGRISPADMPRTAEVSSGAGGAANVSLTAELDAVDDDDDEGEQQGDRSVDARSSRSVHSSAASTRRDVSVNERLKKLAQKIPSRSATPVPAASPAAGDDEEEEAKELTAVQRHAAQPSEKSHASGRTVMPERRLRFSPDIEQRERQRLASASPAPAPAPAPGLIGGRTSSSYAALASSPRRSIGGNGDDRSPSPATAAAAGPAPHLVPDVPSEEIQIRTSQGASGQGLRARAQSYLKQASASANGTPTGSPVHSASASPVPQQRAGTSHYISYESPALPSEPDDDGAFEEEEEEGLQEEQREHQQQPAKFALPGPPPALVSPTRALSPQKTGGATSTSSRSHSPGKRDSGSYFPQHAHAHRPSASASASSSSPTRRPAPQSYSPTRAGAGGTSPTRLGGAAFPRPQSQSQAQGYSPTPAPAPAPAPVPAPAHAAQNYLNNAFGAPPLSTPPLQIKKSVPAGLGMGGAATWRSTAGAGAGASPGKPPAGMSLKERVAFFEGGGGGGK